MHPSRDQFCPACLLCEQTFRLCLGLKLPTYQHCLKGLGKLEESTPPLKAVYYLQGKTTNVQFKAKILVGGVSASS